MEHPFSALGGHQTVTLLKDDMVARQGQLLVPRVPGGAGEGLGSERQDHGQE